MSMNGIFFRWQSVELMRHHRSSKKNLSPSIY
jgi:hypothetical protein